MTNKKGTTFDTIDEAFRLAQRRLPHTLYDALVGGNGRGVTLREDIQAFDEVLFRPRAAVTYPQRDLRTSVLGAEISMPLMISSTGATRVIRPEGEPAVARAASSAGTVDVVAWRTGHTVEEIAAGGGGLLWQQIYMTDGRAGAERVVDRAAKAGYQALVVTVDVAVKPGPGHALPTIGVASAFRYGPELITRPRWIAGFLRDSRRDDVRGKDLTVGPPGSTYTATWDDFAWIRDAWTGPIVVKGIVTAEDARRALDVGAAGIVVSNHGGKALDGIPATLRALPEVLAAVDGAAEVYLDSGIRGGTDVVKAVAMGARAVLIGQAYLMGLAVGGEAGVRRVLEIFREEIDHTLALLGCRSAKDLDCSYVEMPDSMTRRHNQHAEFLQLSHEEQAHGRDR